MEELAASSTATSQTSVRLRVIITFFLSLVSPAFSEGSVFSGAPAGVSTNSGVLMVADENDDIRFAGGPVRGKTR